MKIIKDKIIKTEKLKWRDLKPLQPENLKSMDQADFERLRNSLDNNSFIDAMNVWQSPDGDIYILDGHHRQKMLDTLEKEGYTIPEEFTCNFIECKNRKEAAKYLLIYSARDYAKIQEEGLYDFIELEELCMEELKQEVVIPEIDFAAIEEELNKSDKEEEELNEVPEVKKEAVSRLGDLFLIDGKHRVLCGDSTKEEDVKRLMDGKKADMVFTDPPYDLENFEWALMCENFSQDAHVIIMGDDLQIYEICKITNSTFSRFFISEFPFCSPRGNDAYLKHILIVRLKNGNALPVKNLNDGFSSIIKMNYRGTITREEEVLHQYQKPVSFVELFILHHSEESSLVLDVFLGSGTSLIACEKNNRICYGIELSPCNIDLILVRYKKLYPNSKIECLNRRFNFHELFNG